MVSGVRRGLFRLGAAAGIAGPAAFTGAKVAAAVAVVGAVFGEWSGSDSGLGHLIVNANSELNAPAQFAATVLLIAEAVWASLHGLTALLLDQADHIESPHDLLIAAVLDMLIRGLSAPP